MNGMATPHKKQQRDEEKVDNANKVEPPQEIDGFDAELNALLKKYEHLPKEELVESLGFYFSVVRDGLDW